MVEQATSGAARRETDETLLTIREAAERLNCSTRHLRRKLDEGAICAIRDGGYVRIMLGDLRRYVDERKRRRAGKKFNKNNVR